MDRKQSDKKLRRPELLAPAGDLKRCKTAIRYGADAVYLGGQFYSLRSRASNFTMDDIKEACAFAREYGARIHVTVNVIPHAEDFEGLREYLIKLQEYGVTAIIVASPAIMALARECAPKLEIHCSTQMSVTNGQAACFIAEQLKADRVVLARECSMEDVYDICEESPVDIEAFIHGGMCVNFSGRCTLSNRMTLRDANRGGCAQSCRWQYRVYEDDQELSDDEHLFTMGSRDLFAADHLYDMMKAQVASLKIEGRMKTEYYVASVVSAYRHLIDELYETQAPLSEERMAYHRHEILRGENRETCDGFYSGTAGYDSLIYHANSNADVNHDFLGTVISYNEETQEMVMETRNPLDRGDIIEVLTPGYENRHFTAETIRDSKGEYIEQSRHPMSHLTMQVPFTVSKGDILRRAR